MRLQFQYPEAAFLLLGAGILVLLFILYMLWRKRVIRRLGDPVLVAALLREVSPVMPYVRFFLLISAFLLAVIGLMNLRQPGGDLGGSRKGIDVVMALDLSKSMWARDAVESMSRLEKAKGLIHYLVDQMPDNRIALVLFAGRAYLHMPLTSDHAATRLFVNTADPADMPQKGTVLSEAMRTSALAFNNKERKFKSVVLITDGEDHDPEAVNTARELAEQGILINTIGIGSPAGASIIEPATGEPKKDAQGNIVISRLNAGLLQEIASETKGIYTSGNDLNEAAKVILEKLSGVERESLSDISLVNFTSYYLWFGIPALLLIVIEFFMSDKRKRRIAPQAILVPSLFLFTAFQIQAQSQLNDGNRLYRNGDFAGAERDYQNIISTQPGNMRARYNLALAQYRLNKTDTALSSMESVVLLSDDTNLRSKSFYNRGAVFSVQKKLDESIEAYKAALRLNPNDTLARENLQKALMERKAKNTPNKKPENPKKPKENPKKQPPPPQMNPKQAMRQLSKLQEKEQKTRQQLQQKRRTNGGFEKKDW